MSAETLVVGLEALGVRLWEEEGQLHFRAPAGVMNQERLGELRDHKQAVLEYLRQAALATAIEPDIQARHDPFPLTDVQAAYLLGRRDAFDYGGVACQVYGEVAFSELIPERIETAWHVLVHRHDMLRAVIHTSGHQRVLEQVPDYRIRVTDVRGASPADLATAIEVARGEMDHRFYQPDEWPLFDLRVTIGDERALLHFSIDFLIADYLSIQRLLDELIQFYGNPSRALPPLEIGFRDYVLADRRRREGGRYERDREHWQARVDALPAAPELPVLDQSTGTSPARFRRYQLTIPSERWTALRRRASEHKITPSCAVLAAYAEIIGRWSRRAHFMLNLTLLNRQALHPQVGELVGDFTTVSLLEVDRAATVPFGARAQELQAQLWQDIDHRLFSGVEVMREIARRRGRAAALMPVIFTSTIGLADGEMNDAPLEGELVFGLSQTPQVWIDCQAVERRGELVVSWDVRDGVFPDGLVEDMFSALRTLLEGLAQEDAPWDLDCPVALPAAQRERRERVNDTARPMPGGLLHGGFLAQALRSPERPAVLSRHRSLDYGELLAHATAVRDALKDAGCSQGDMVAIVMDKGWEQIAAVLGTLLASAVYVPVDTTQPPARREEMLDAATARVVLTQSWIADTTEWPASTQAISVDTVTPTTPDRHMLERCVQPDDLAYVIFTSGSSGKPKGVMMSHRGALNTIEDINKRFGVGVHDRVLGLAHLGFDLSVYDIFGPLARGGCIVLPDADRRGDPSHWAELVAEHAVTVWNSVPAQMQMLDHYLQATPDFELPSLRLALLSGDWIPVGLPHSIRERLTGLRLISLGGATEAAIWSIFHPIEEVPASWRSIPYGKPLTNQAFYVLDHMLLPSPDWTPGEIYIGGAGLARGYLGDPEKTAERFIEHPLSGQRLYRTGDFGRYLPDGSIEFLGREDRQVKIRGHRIELAEIEAALQSHPAVAAAAALIDGRRPLERQLAGFVQTARRTSEAPSERDSAERVRDVALAAGEEATATDDRELFVEFVSALNEVALLEIVHALRRDGLFAIAQDTHTVDEVLDRARVAAQHRRLVRRWLAALEHEGLLARDSETDRYRAAPPLEEASVADAWLRVERLLAQGRYQPEVVQYLRRSSEHLPQLMRGEEDPLRLLFPEGRLDTAQATYGEYLIGRYINRVVTATVTEVAAQAPTAGPLRILEVGAGVGGTSAELIPALADSQVEYQFSDISQFFLNEAHARFAEYPWVAYRTFDLNENYRAQELRPNSFEVIVAANVLHYAEHIGEALARLRELLAPGGWLVFVEATHDTHWIMASMELMETEGDFQDLRRGRDQTFLGREQWTELLAQAGADTTLCLPGAGHVLAPIGQHIFAARFKNDRMPLRLDGLNEHLAARLPEYMIPPHLQVVDSLPLSQNGKVDNAALRSWLPRNSGEQILVGGEPRDELERRLAEVWGEMLGVARVGRDHDFFELGGDSLLVSQVTARILEIVPEASGLYFDHLMLRMLDEPRVAALAAFLREGPQLAEERVRGRGDLQLVRLDGADSDSAPLDGGCVSVLVHDELGTVAHYGELARELAHQGPVVGLTINDTRAYLELDTTGLVEQVASRYSQLISDAFSQPLRIIGYSAGATLATEVARAAIEAGAEVEELVLIDPQHIQCLLEDDIAIELAFAHAVGIDPESLGFPTEGLLAPAFDATGNGDPRRVPDGAIAAFAATSKTVSLQRLAQRPSQERLAAILRAAGALRPDLEATRDLAGCFDRFRHSLAAYAQHHAQLYAGNITLLRPSEARSLPWQAQDPTEHWRGLCIGELRIVEIPGDHVGSLQAPQVERTAELVRGGQSTAAQIP
jgi:pyochelin synthetase